MSTEIEKETAEEPVNQVEESGSTMKAGDLLRTKRELLGISQEEIAARLRLKLSVIQNIDANNFSADQVATFTRGYLRSYAKAVSVDEKEVIAALDGSNEVQHSEQSMQSFSRKTKREKHDRRIMKLTWVIFLIIVGISSIWWYQNQQDSLSPTSVSESSTSSVKLPESSLVSPASDEPASPDRSKFAPTPETEVSPTDEQPSQPLPENGASSDSSLMPESEAIATSREEKLESTPEPEIISDKDEEIVITEVEGSPVEKLTQDLVMRFSADCWILVKDASGKTLTTGVKKAGSTLTVSGQTPYSVTLGAPKGVSMEFANESVDLSMYNSGKVAKFTLPRS